MKEELYKKVGRRYKPVNDPWAYDGLREGHWHVWVRPGSVTIREFVFPNKYEVLAAIEEVKEAMIEAMLKHNTVKLQAITKKEKKAAAAYRAIMGPDAPLVFEGASMLDVVEAGIKVLRDH